VDAIGLATPELVKHMSPLKLQTLWALRELRPPYVMVFDAWFPEWRNRPSVLIPIYTHDVDISSGLGSRRTIVFRPDWDRFERYYSKELIDRLDPPVTHLSFAHHWRRGQANLGVKQRGELFAEAGDMRHRVGDLDAAQELYRRAIEIDPELESGWLGALELYRKRADAAGALALLQAMLRANPTSTVALEALGDLQASIGNDPESKHRYETALALYPDSMRLLQKLAASYIASGQAERAVPFQRRLEELGPGLSVPPLPVPPGRAASLGRSSP
jgi:tetratricopeptide (TPR) repeat protein